MKENRGWNVSQWTTAYVLAMFLAPILFFSLLVMAKHSSEKQAQRDREFEESIDREQEIGNLPAEYNKGDCGQSNYFIADRIEAEAPYTRLAYPLTAQRGLWVANDIAQFKVVIDDSKQKPTTKTIRHGRTEHYVIRLSQADYDKAPCLQEARRANQ